MDSSTALELLGEKTVHQKVNPRLVAYNPSMELLALGSIDQQVVIYRLNGQRIYGSSPKTGNSRVDGFCWKPNGTQVSSPCK
jgi:anaphase-promoting complex subunit 4